MVVIEHPSGRIQVTIDSEMVSDEFVLHSAGLVRTARLLARGEVMVPQQIWPGEAAARPGNRFFERVLG